MSQTTSNQITISLDDTLNAMNHWRDNKGDKQQYPETGIPTKVWKMVFALERQGHSGNQIRRIFSLNSTQYHKKKIELEGEPLATPTKNGTQPTGFCEAVTAKNKPSNVVPPLTSVDQTKQAIKQLKSTQNKPEEYLDSTTIIVECIRPDGHRLKIHTTSQSLDVVMQTFYQQQWSV